jgi:myosin-5
MFNMEQQEYKKEKVPWDSINYVDNQGCIDLIESKTKISIFKMLNEQCMLNGKDKAFADSIQKNLGGNQFFGRPDKFSTKFLIKHYAGPVTYYSENFIEKNKDTVNEQIERILKGSSHKVIQILFAAKAGGAAPKKAPGGNKNVGKLGAGAAKGKGVVGETICSQFSDQLQELITTLSESNPRYVRCIKPNNNFSSD